MKVLLLGSTGMAGHAISLYFKEQGHDITTFSRTPFSYCKNIVGNAMDSENLKQVLLDGSYDIVINCIGVLIKAAEDNKYITIYLNSLLSHFIVYILKNKKTRLIHLSTDCVFSGEKGNYIETSFRDGKTFYDRTKALGEIEDNKNLTFRNSFIGPDINMDGIGLFNWFMKQRNKIDGYINAIWTGVTTLTLAKAIEKVAEDNLTGLYHLVNNYTISKYELLKLFNKYFKNNKTKIIPYDSICLNKSLVNTRNDFNFFVPSYEEMISDMKDWVYSHKKLYPHYFN